MPIPSQHPRGAFPNLLISASGELAPEPLGGKLHRTYGKKRYRMPNQPLHRMTALGRALMIRLLVEGRRR